MPVYEYVCQDCGHRFDMLRPMKDADRLVPCNNCNQHRTNRVLSTFYAQSQGRSITRGGQSCGNCSGGSCGSCGCGRH